MHQSNEKQEHIKKENNLAYGSLTKNQSELRGLFSSKLDRTGYDKLSFAFGMVQYLQLLDMSQVLKEFSKKLPAKVLSPESALKPAPVATRSASHSEMA